MGKTLTLICVIALGVALAIPAYAEVQNIKVSGDMTVRSLHRDAYDLDDNDGGTNDNDSDNYFMQAVGVNVDADLTDNVEASVRLVNQRNWDNNSSGANTFDVDMDLAYVTLKEMLYEPLTLKIGRQDLWFGRGFVVGANIQDFNGAIGADEYTETTAFDAIRATLDYAPWTVDLVYSKIDENGTTAANDDVNLYGVNVGYIFDSMNGEAEAYYFGKHDASIASANVKRVNTYGIRGSMEPMENVVVGAEGAVQAGDYSDVTVNTRDIKAYAANAYGDVSFPDVMWTPTVGLEVIYLTGEKNVSGAVSTDSWNGWDAMYRGKFDTAIRDFQNYLYNTAARGRNTLITEWDQDSGLTNQLSLLVKSSFIPMEDVLVDATYAHFWLEESGANDGAVLLSDDDIGDEIDLLLTYDYTEDVSFGLLAAWFFPGDMFPGGQDDTATDVVGSMKVVF